jgi:hypothetical protein
VPEAEDDRPRLAPRWGPRWLGRAAAVLGAVYLLSMWVDAIGTGIPERLFPLPLRFFVQEAALFPRAAPNAIEWRVQAFFCGPRRFSELDVRPFFPIRADDKESRFARAMFFHHNQYRVMEALDAYISAEQNRAHPDAPIGGVMLLSLRLPIPPPGSDEPRYRRLPLTDYPRAVERHYWYVTPTEDRTRRCEAAP